MPEGAPHADEARLRALTRGELPRDEALALSQHLLDCDVCAALLEHVEADTAVRRNVGRYVVLDEVGRGGMGKVLRGWDPQLERFVAVKRLLDAGRAESQARLLREAQAMAKVTHPNLVAVFDAGLSDGDVYLVMEFVKGPSLAQWLSDSPRGWRDVLRLFLQAGRGLAAAHAAGLVHRDFKPSNVLVQSGVAKVTDFGLALAANEQPMADAPAAVPPPVSSGRSNPPSSSGASARVTRAGVNAGTPEYMAPEQFRGVFDARSDQFSFARSLEQALAPLHPPRWVYEALRRALSPEPSQRYPALEPLLLALDPDVRARRTLAVQVAVVSVVVLGGVVAFGARARSVDCSTAQAPMRATWSQAGRATVERSLLALPTESAQRTLAALDAWSQRWLDASQASCQATAAGQQSERVELLKRLCLERRLAFFGTVVSQAGTLSADQVVKIAGELPAVDCSDAELVATAAADESEELRSRLQPVRVALGQVQALVLAGLDKQATAQVEPLLVKAREIGFAPVLAEAALFKGQSLRDFDLATSRAALQEAYRALAALPSASASTVELGARVALQLIDTYATEAESFEALRPVTEAALVRAGDAPSLRSMWGLTRGRALHARGQMAEAVEEMKRAYELRLQVSGPDAERTLLARLNYAVTLEAAGQTDDAVANFGALVEANRRLYGERSLPTARALARLGATEVVAVHYVKAREHLSQARETFRTLGVPDTDDFNLLDNLASLSELSGDFAASLPMRRQILEQVNDPPVRAKQWGLLSRVLFETGDLNGAREQANAARKALSDINPQHPDLLVPLTTLGRLTPGAEGIKLLERALALPDARDPEYRGDALLALAEHQTGEKRTTLTREALASYEEGEVAFRVEALRRRLVQP